MLSSKDEAMQQTKCTKKKKEIRTKLDFAEFDFFFFPNTPPLKLLPGCLKIIAIFTWWYILKISVFLLECI